MRLASLLVALLALASARGEAEEPAAAPEPPPPAFALVARPVEQAPGVDGELSEALWQTEPVYEVLAGPGAKAPRLRLQAVTTADALYVAVGWPDAARATREQPQGACPAFRAVLSGTPPKVWTWDGDNAEPAPGADVAGFCADGGCSVEFTRPLTASSDRAALLHGQATALRLEVRAADGLPAGVDVLLRRGGPLRRLTFEDDAVGAHPEGLTAALAGKGAAPAWVVRAAGKSKVLVQESQDQTDARFPLALAAGVVARDVDLSVRFQAMDGFKDRAAGLVWRVKDAANHYILRANALERNVVLYKMQDGLRVDLPPAGREADYGVKVEFDPAAWHTLRVLVVGERFEAYLDGRLLFHVRDATFADPGTVGLWTKSDSVTAFDDLTLVPLDAPSAGR